MTINDERSQRRVLRIFAGVLAVLCVFGSIIYLGKRTSPILEPDPSSSKEDLSGEKKSLLDEQYQELFKALSEDDIGRACTLCDTIVPDLSGDLSSGDSLEREIFLLCESARERDLATKKALIEKRIASLSEGALVKRLEEYRRILSLDKNDRNCLEKVRALEEQILQTSQEKLEKALEEKDFSKAHSLCGELPQFFLVSPDVLDPLCDQASKEWKKRRIQTILAQVKPLPASDYLGNLRGYRELAVLDPTKELYWEKIERYRASAEKARSRSLRRAEARMTYDVNTGTFWYFPSIAEKRHSQEGAHIYFYIGQKDDGTTPRLRLVCLLNRKEPFSADQLILSFEGGKYAFPLEKKWVHFTEGFMWCDILIPESGKILDLLERFSQASKGSFAFAGSGKEPLLGWTLSGKELQGLRRMLGLYEDLQK